MRDIMETHRQRPSFGRGHDKNRQEITLKFRRKPVDRTIIDAIKLDGEYVWADAGGVTQRMPHKEFEELYQPAHASPERKPKRRRGSPPATP